MFLYKKSAFTKRNKFQAEPFLNYEDDIVLDDAQRYLRPEPRHSVLRVYLLATVITSVAWLFLFYIKGNFFPHRHYYTSPLDYLNRHNITTGARLLECGNSTQEAKSLGCQYDVLLNHWVPAPCIDHDFLEEYMDDNSWVGYIDEALTQPISTVEEMSESEFYFTSLRDHINHCAMLWKKQFWVLYKEYTAFDTIIANPSHTDHCAFFLTEAKDVDLDQATRVEKGYAGCWVRE